MQDSRFNSRDLSGPSSERLALRPREAARALGVGERTLRQLLPEIPHVRVGSAVVIPIDLLREWLRKRARSEPARTDAVVKEILSELESG